MIRLFAMKPKLSIFIFIFSHLHSGAHIRRITRKTEKPLSTRQGWQRTLITKVEKPKRPLGFSIAASVQQQRESIVLQRSSSYSSNSIVVCRPERLAPQGAGEMSGRSLPRTVREDKFSCAGVSMGRGGEKLHSLSTLDPSVLFLRSGGKNGMGGLAGKNGRVYES